jgi:hypothetical protein
MGRGSGEYPAGQSSITPRQRLKAHPESAVNDVTETLASVLCDEPDKAIGLMKSIAESDERLERFLDALEPRIRSLGGEFQAHTEELSTFSQIVCSSDWATGTIQDAAEITQIIFKEALNVDLEAEEVTDSVGRVLEAFHANRSVRPLFHTFRLIGGSHAIIAHSHSKMIGEFGFFVEDASACLIASNPAHRRSILDSLGIDRDPGLTMRGWVNAIHEFLEAATMHSFEKGRASLTRILQSSPQAA